ncbi:hypothetical protein P170DRAFT_106165 [Aspergillus steynii IBT 23096]|uniref:Uncharacterized protein n=1 Tax=Aspergillus steynii IBT 23096 TaxID=1392250 RepID=A0A2I2GI46_9EURO|nr:uncharacterized protein P170DRAFT_106165 [Aspergillus steynii IBT 23096]PLB52550.1 hypothetical protein P170DRAFT_106165 [Aspergillus steynii IBT 23096]
MNPQFLSLLLGTLTLAIPIPVPSHGVFVTNNNIDNPINNIHPTPTPEPPVDPPPTVAFISNINTHSYYQPQRQHLLSVPPSPKPDKTPPHRPHPPKGKNPRGNGMCPIQSHHSNQSQG